MALASLALVSTGTERAGGSAYNAPEKGLVDAAFWRDRTVLLLLGTVAGRR
jgi:hypothetical protein